MVGEKILRILGSLAEAPVLLHFPADSAGDPADLISGVLPVRDFHPLLFFVGGSRPLLCRLLRRRHLRARCRLSRPFAGVWCGHRSRLEESLATLVRNFLLFWWSYLLHLLYHEASHQVLQGVEVAIGILYIRSPELLLCLLYAVADREVRIKMAGTSRQFAPALYN